jgi:hypothetical protein
VRGSASRRRHHPGAANRGKQKTRHEGGFLVLLKRVGLDAETFETLLELRQAAAAIEQGLLAAGPGRWVVGSISRFIVSPSLPQVERVVYSVPLVMTILMAW